MDLMEFQAKELFAKHGVAKVFTPGATTSDITGWVAEHFAE